MRSVLIGSCDVDESEDPVTLRPLELQDADVMAEWAVDPEFCRAADWTADPLCVRLR